MSGEYDLFENCNDSYKEFITSLYDENQFTLHQEDLLLGLYQIGGGTINFEMTKSEDLHFSGTFERVEDNIYQFTGIFLDFEDSKLYFKNFNNPTYIITRFKKSYEELIEKKNKEIDIWTEEEFYNFISHVDKFKELFIILYFTGLRLGETLALTWNDFNNDSIVCLYLFLSFPLFWVSSILYLYF